MKFIQKLKEKARQNKRKIVLPEGTEERTLKAADIILEEDFADIILIGRPDLIKGKIDLLNLKNLNKVAILNPENYDKQSVYQKMLYDLRKSKGMTMEEAGKFIHQPLYISVLMIKNGDADGEVAGAESVTGDVLRPAFQIVKTMPGISVVSGAFIMVLKDKSLGENGILVFADGAVHPLPNENELAEIAVATSYTARTIAGIDPRVAMISFSTKGSARHELVDKVVAATKRAKEIDPELKIDGELQVDAALVPSIGASKAPESTIAGKANVLVFPDLQSGNIAYKLVERLAGADAIGPILQGMAAPINDLSRGCSVDDIVNMVAITANQAI